MNTVSVHEGDMYELQDESAVRKRLYGGSCKWNSEARSIDNNEAE